MTVSFVLREELLWAKPGHEIAFGQKIFAAKSPANGGTIGDAAAEYEGKCVTNRKAGLQIIRGKWNLGGEGVRILTYCFPTTAADWCPTATWEKS